MRRLVGRLGVGADSHRVVWTSLIRSRLLALLACLAVFAAACSGDGSAESAPIAEGTTSTAAVTTTVVGSEVTVVKDLVYLAADPVPWKLDVYHSPDFEGGPVVVFFHAPGFGRGYAIYQVIAEAITAGGGVVFLPDWDDTLPTDVDDFVASFDAAACAVAYAAAHASDYGADPETLVLAGHSGGASVPPAAGGLREVSPVADCVVAMDATEVDGMVLWDGDWLMGDSTWDRFGADLPAMMDAAWPWGMLEDASKVPVVLATSSGSPDELVRCGVDDPDSSYWGRDPDGWFRDQLEQRGMLDDGCIDNGEGEELLTQTMSAHGFDATHLILEDSGHLALSDRGQAQLVEAILTISN